MTSAPDLPSADLQSIAQRGVEAWRQGNAAAARQAFDTVVAAGRATPQLWLLLAQACDSLDDRPAAHAALDQVLAADRANLYALLMKGDILWRGGDSRAATAWYNAALGVADTAGELPPDLVAGLENAARASAQAAAGYAAHLHATLARAGVQPGALPPRFGEALDILAGVRQPFFQAPTSFFYPGLPHTAFFDPADFAWIAALEAAAPAMAAEVEAVLAADAGLTPYVERPKDRPAKQHALLEDARWSAFHLWKDGALVADNAGRCPATMAALADAPIPRIRGRSPMVLFSILRPGTHIPPHNGMLNTRLICHIPLIVPPDCRLRVGSETRHVEAGRALVFDDSIEHEAWNDSDRARAILLFEIWRPELSADERAALTAMFESISDFDEGQAPSASRASS